ncbi:MAG: sulfotransferase domain-containing protein [Rivularia sp. (in: cyanobacteria)]
MNIIIKKSESLMRYLMVHHLSEVIPLYIVNEYPKSGGTWVSQMLARALNVPFPQNRFPSLRSSIMQGHYLNPNGMKNIVVVWRDGRDIMVSWYYHCLFKHDCGKNAALVDIVSNDLKFKNPEDIRNNLPIFIEYSFTKQRHPRFSWTDFVHQWYQHPGIISVRYESLHKNAVSQLQRVVWELTGKDLEVETAIKIVEEFSFVRQSGRKPGEIKINSFLRKGVVGDWQNHFSQEACEVFNHFAGNELITLGYENDTTWVNSKGIKIAMK